MEGLKKGRSGHACRPGAMLSHACSAGATCDRSSMMVLTTILTRVMQICVLKMDQQFAGGDDF
jgi:hypothetical protein